MRVLLVPNVHNPAAVSAARELGEWLKDRADVVVSAADASAAGLPDLSVPPSELGALSLVVALGGDGTILKAFHAIGDVEVPILGVKFGRLGFLAGTAPENMRESIETALRGEASIERRATLKAEIVMDGRVTGTYRAMNEVAVGRGSTGRLIAVEVSISGKRIARHRADGLIVATATGSTAYSLSAGGPMVAPGFGGMLVVPVASHTLQSRAILTEPSDSVEIGFPDPSRSDAGVVVDGDVAPCRQSVQRVVVTRGDHDVSLVKCHGRDFYETIAEEFFGG